jgi:SAM-dependent methyltransferase
VEFIQQFLRQRHVRSVIDYGCGDWQVSRLVDWSGVDYIGCDVVDEIVERNRRSFARNGIRFMELKGQDDNLPSADLFIVKDVLQHWPNEQVSAFLPRLAAYRYSLVTNCVALRGETRNSDIHIGDFRPLDIRLPPFSVQASEQLTFENGRPAMLKPFLRARWRKTVLLVEGAEALSTV